MESKNLLHHKALYKSPRGNALPWKDAYRKRCFERIRSSRDDLLEQFRRTCGSANSLLLSSKEDIKKLCSPAKTVHDIMEEEWSAICKNRSFPSLNKYINLHNCSFEEDSEDEITRELWEIQNELVSEEEALFNEILNFDAAALQSQITMFQENEVICPICKIRNLKEVSCTLPLVLNNNNNYQTPPRRYVEKGSKIIALKCDCGLTLSKNGISLNVVQTALQSTINTHEQTCLLPLTFTATDDHGGTNVLIQCISCGWMSYLL